MLTPKLETVTCERPYFLLLKYQSGERFLFDMEPYLSKNEYKELINWNYFTQVKKTEDELGVEWPNGENIPPFELYTNGDWAEDDTKLTFQSSLSIDEIHNNFKNEKFFERIIEALKEVEEIEKIEKLNDDLWRIKRKSGK